MTVAFIECPSPNFGDRRGRDIDMVVVHYTGMVSCAASLERLCDAASQVSAHYLIDEDGTVFRLVPEAHRAWHAGKSAWQGERDINSISIGIELHNPGHEHGYRDFPAAQISALIALIGEVRSRHEIPAGRIVGHEDVAPGRKQDPGEKFPWDKVREALG